MCKTIKRSSTLEALLNIIKDDLNDDVFVFSCMEIIWNVLDDKVGKEAALFFGGKDQLTALCNALQSSSRQCYRQVDKQKRNDLLLMCTRVLEYDPSAIANLGKLGLLDFIFELLTMQEFKSDMLTSDPLLMVFLFDETNGPDDFEFKRILVTITKFLCTDASNRNHFIKNGLLSFCLVYMECESTNSGVKIWNAMQQSMLQIQVLGLITDLVGEYIKDFTAINGPLTIVTLLDSLIQKSSLIEPSRMDLSRTHNSLIESCLLALTTLSERGPIFKKLLGSYDIFKHLLRMHH